MTNHKPEQVSVATASIRDKSPVNMPVEPEKVDSHNPANSPEQRVERMVTARNRVPMSVPHRTLEVPNIPGFYTHWVVSSAGRIAQALRAGYTFVEQSELPGYEYNSAHVTGTEGNSDLGSRVSVVAGGYDDDSKQSLRLYLMKLPDEFREADNAARDAEGMEFIGELRSNVNPNNQTSGDTSNRYVPDIGGITRDSSKSKSFNVFDTLHKRR